MKASDEALAAARKGDSSLLRAEAAEFAKGARGDAKVFVGNGKGDVFWEAELPELLKSVNEGDLWGQ